MSSFQVPEWLKQEVDAMIERSLEDVKAFEQSAFGRQLTDAERKYYAAQFAVSNDEDDDE